MKADGQHSHGSCARSQLDTRAGAQGLSVLVASGYTLQPAPCVPPHSEAGRQWRVFRWRDKDGMKVEDDLGPVVLRGPCFVCLFVCFIYVSETSGTLRLADGYEEVTVGRRALTGNATVMNQRQAGSAPSMRETS